MSKVGVALAIALCCLPRAAHAWSIGSQLNERGCHELITAQALRDVRATLATAPAITPTRDEAAAIADVLFEAPADFVPDLAGMALLLGVRDNDIQGIDPTSSLELIQIQANPLTQDEHCLRAPSDDFDPAGDLAAIARCRTFIHDQATAALAGLSPDGTVDATNRVSFQVQLGIAGNVHLPLPLFYIRIAAAMHAIEDGFAHAYRTADGMQVTTVLNWVDLVDGTYDATRDGPAHRLELDDCRTQDPTIQRNYTLAVEAAAELLAVALDPARSSDDKIAQFDVVTAKYLTYQPGCTATNQWCDPPEAHAGGGCAVGGGAAGWLGALVVALLVVPRRRRALAALGVLALVGAAAHADPSEPSEPGRDVKTPSPAEISAVREAKQLGSPFGVTAVIGGSVDRPAVVGAVGARYRFTETWLVGVDVAWNPWITTAPVKTTRGAAEAYLTVIRRYPMRYDRVNLRSSVHLGTSVLLFDVYGAPKYSTGLYGAVSLLGLDYDLGHSWRLVVDPAEIALPVPNLGPLPLWYEQFRFVVGVQYGS